MRKLQGVFLLLLVISQVLLVACGSTAVDTISTPVSPAATLVITTQPIATQESTPTGSPVPTMTPSPAQTSPATSTSTPTIIPTASSTSTPLASAYSAVTDLADRTLVDASGKTYILVENQIAEQTSDPEQAALITEFRQAFAERARSQPRNAPTAAELERFISGSVGYATNTLDNPSCYLNSCSTLIPRTKSFTLSSNPSALTA